MITIGQIKAARAFLGFDQIRLAAESKVSLPTIQRIENPNFGPSRSTVRLVKAIMHTLEDAGIEFILPSDGKGPGVRLKRPVEGE